MPAADRCACDLSLKRKQPKHWRNLVLAWSRAKWSRLDQSWNANTVIHYFRPNDYSHITRDTTRTTFSCMNNIPASFGSLHEYLNMFSIAPLRRHCRSCAGQPLEKASGQASDASKIALAWQLAKPVHASSRLEQLGRCWCDWSKMILTMSTIWILIIVIGTSMQQLVHVHSHTPPNVEGESLVSVGIMGCSDITVDIAWTRTPMVVEQLRQNT